MSATVGFEKKKVIFVPPDGGWGYAIWIAVIINMIATNAFAGSFGIIYKQLFIDLDMGSTSITLLNGVSSVCVSLSGFMAGVLLKFTSMRRVAFIGAVFINLGSLGLIFVNSKIVLFICHGILFGLGHGALTNMSFTVINAYFVKRRLLSFSICQSISAVATLFSPQLVKYFLNFYGFRGTLMLLLAINLHTLVAGCLIQPVSWHYKKIEVEIENDTEMQLLLDKDKKCDVIEKDVNEHTDKEKGPQLNVTKNEPDSYKSTILEVLDVSLLRSFLLSNTAIGMAVCGASDLIFSFFLPQILYSMRFTEDQVALAVSLLGFGDLLTKIIFILFNNLLIKFQSRQIYVAGVFVAAATRIGMLTTTNVTAILTCIAIMGISRCTIFLLIPLVISDVVKPEQFSSTTGLLMLEVGFTNLILAPTVGAVRDITDSYPAALFVLIFCFTFVFISFSIELYKKNRKSRNELKKSSSVNDKVCNSDTKLQL